MSPSHCAGPSSSCVSNTLSCSAYNTYTAQASAFLVSLTPYHALPMTLTHTVQASLFLYLQHPIMLRLQHTHTAQASALLVSSTPCYALLWHALTLCRPQLFLHLQHPITPCLWHTHTHTHTHAHTHCAGLSSSCVYTLSSFAYVAPSAVLPLVVARFRAAVESQTATHQLVRT